MLQYFNPKAWKRLQLGAGVVEHWRARVCVLSSSLSVVAPTCSRPQQRTLPLVSVGMCCCNPTPALVSTVAFPLQALSVQHTIATIQFELQW